MRCVNAKIISSINAAFLRVQISQFSQVYLFRNIFIISLECDLKIKQKLSYLI